MRRQLVGGLVAVCIAAGLVLAAAPSGGQTATCQGRTPTIVATGGTTVGTPGPDVILGTPGNDRIESGAGNDIICAGAGDDIVRAGPGRDSVELGAGADRAWGGSGADTIRGGSGRDRIEGNSGRDTLIGGKARDVILGGKGADTCSGGTARDSLISCATRDRSAFHVSPGSSGNGTPDSPFGTIAQGIDALRPGDTLYLHGGVYREVVDIDVSGAPGALVKIRNLPGQRPVIDGAGVPTVAGWSPLISIVDQSHIRVRGIELRDRIATQSNHVPIGILIAGSGDRIQIRDNEVHRIEARASGVRNGHGIAAYGNRSGALTNVEIHGNHVHDLVLGTSEAVVVNGNVDGFELSDNHIHDADNIAIDIIGGEGFGPSGRDAARNGRVTDNHIHDIDARPNPVNGRPDASGVYVDGGRNVLIARNLIHDTNIGVTIGSEHLGRDSEDVTVRDNVIHHNHVGAIYVGGYAASTGGATDCRIEHNTLVANDTLRTYTGELAFRWHVDRCVLRANVLRASSQGLLVTDFGNASDVSFAQNLHHTTGQRAWTWQGDFITTMRTWRSAVGATGSRFANPDFVDIGDRDYRLSPSSPGYRADSGTDLGAAITSVGPE